MITCTPAAPSRASLPLFVNIFSQLVVFFSFSYLVFFTEKMSSLSMFVLWVGFLIAFVRTLLNPKWQRFSPKSSAVLLLDLVYPATVLDSFISSRVFYVDGMGFSLQSSAHRDGFIPSFPKYFYRIF